MCSIIIVNQVQKDFPLIIAGNRDEDVSRAFTGVQLLSSDPKIIGGRDELHKGTWLAVNEKSIFAAITNQGNRVDGKKSRGEIILNILKQPSLDKVMDVLEDIDPSQYNGFNLIFGDNKSVYIAYSYILHSIVIHEVKKGISIITNDMTFNGQKNSKITAIHKYFKELNPNSEWTKYYNFLKDILRDENMLLKGKQHKTTSSSILAFDKNGLSKYKFVDRTKKGCKYVGYSDLLK